MEDEAAKRRERLKALRKEAEQTKQLDTPPSSLPSGPLSNPFADTSDTSSTANDSSHAPRFDYYSDPLAAFSANKRKNIDRDQMNPSSRKLVRNKKAICTCEAPILGPCLRCKGEEEEEKEVERGQMISSSPMPDQLQAQYSSGVRPVGGNTPSAGRHYPWSSPMPIPYPPPLGSPIPGHLACNPYEYHQGFGSNFFPYPTSQNQKYPSQPNHPFSGQNVVFPLDLRSPNPVYPQGNWYPPSFDNGRGGGPIPAGGRNSYAPRYGRGSGGGFGRGNEVRPLFMGRGRMGHDHDRNRNSGFDNRGVKLGDNTLIQGVDNVSGSSLGLNRKRFKSFDEKAKSFYLESMVEDPWRGMKPVVRDPSKTTVSRPDFEKGWLPNSIRSKSAKPEETVKFRSDLNFADCLADSLKEATGSM